MTLFLNTVLQIYKLYKAKAQHPYYYLNIIFLVITLCILGVIVWLDHKEQDEHNMHRQKWIKTIKISLGLLLLLISFIIAIYG